MNSVIYSESALSNVLDRIGKLNEQKKEFAYDKLFCELIDEKLSPLYEERDKICPYFNESYKWFDKVAEKIEEEHKNCCVPNKYAESVMFLMRFEGSDYPKRRIERKNHVEFLCSELQY